MLCRLALQDGAIDPLSFTALRLASGAVALAPLLWRGPRPWSLPGALALLLYAACFSLAYVSLETGTGALLLFGAVQLTMMGVGFRQGERPSGRRTVGVLVALAGLVALLLPGASAPSALGATLMVAAGISWGAYSLIGRRSRAPSASHATACNFVLATPFALVLPAFDVDSVAWTLRGVLLAVCSGTLTSALGYVLWYRVLPTHSATSASVVQLSVPVLAAIAGVAFLGETPTSRLLTTGALTLGGVLLAILSPARR